MNARSRPSIKDVTVCLFGGSFDTAKKVYALEDVPLLKKATSFEESERMALEIIRDGSPSWRNVTQETVDVKMEIAKNPCGKSEKLRRLTDGLPIKLIPYIHWIVGYDLATVTPEGLAAWLPFDSIKPEDIGCPIGAAILSPNKPHKPEDNEVFNYIYQILREQRRDCLVYHDKVSCDRFELLSTNPFAK